MLDFVFCPSSIAVVGVSSDSIVWNAGREYLRCLIDSGFKGELYPIGAYEAELFGLRVYRNLREIPGPVEYVIVAIPAQHTPQLVMDCAAKGVKAIHFFSAGFSEIEDEIGKHLEAEILRIARESGIRIIGPNCLGVYCPKTGLSFTGSLPGQPGFPKQSGPFGFMAQSGGNSTYCVRAATTRGVFFSKVVSYGNACDLNEADFLEYFLYDPETKIIGAYLEGVKEGHRFAQLLRRVAKTKPVIIFKAGKTAEGARAAASHTSAIASSAALWPSLMRQAGAIEVNSIEEIVDVALLFTCGLSVGGRYIGGKRVAVIGFGGGANVQAADACSEAGLVLPLLPVEARRKLKDVYGSEAGRSFRNPVDVDPLVNSKIFLDAARIVDDCEQIDFIITHASLDMWSFARRDDVIKFYTEAMLKLYNEIRKPLVIALHSQVTAEAKRLASESHAQLRRVGLPVYLSVEQAAKAISRYLWYYQWLEEAEP